MKKSILLLLVVLSASALMGADESYNKKMGETIRQFSTCQSVEDYQNLANQFNVIARKETEEWLPMYYEAQCYILMSFRDENLAVRDGFLDQADDLISKTLRMAPRESEVHTLQAFYYTGRLVINPAERAQTTSPKINASLRQALDLEPNNPRAQFMMLSNELGTARFFGSDTGPYRLKAENLLETWDSYTLHSPIHPQWGKAQLEEIVNSIDN